MAANPVHASPKKRFDRWNLGWGRTCSYRLFKGHHTQLNSLYWAHAPAFRYVFAATRTRERADPADSLLTLVPPNSTRINLPLGEWGKNYCLFDNWVRLNALVSITGYLEVYIKTVTRLALESDPGLLIGLSRSIDGVSALKRVPDYSFADRVVDCVRKTWPERIVAYSKFFGNAPAILQARVNELDKLRIIRNGVTHTFGRSTEDYNALLEMRPKPFKKISELYLQESLGLVDEIALAIDSHLGPTHIGEYESLNFYHHWDKRFDLSRTTEAKALRARLYVLHGRNRHPAYYEGLIEAYNLA